MADINATDLTQETLSTLDGSEQFVMFDSAEGKRATLAATSQYAVTKQTASLNGSTQTVQNAIAGLQTNINAKQNTLTAGTNISISGSTISATDTTYPTITQAQIETGTSTTPSVVTPAVFNSAVESVVDTWLDDGDTLLSSTTITLWEGILGIS